MKRLPLVAWLAVVWVALWGSVTAANVLGGLAVGTVLAVALPLNDVDARGVVKPLALLRVFLDRQPSAPASGASSSTRRA